MDNLLQDVAPSPGSVPASVEPVWAEAPAAVAERLDVAPGDGLTSAEADRRRAEIGPNALRKHERRSVWDILASQFKSLIIALLVAAALVAFAFGDTLEGWAIVVVIVINTAIGFGTEWSAVQSMESLRALGQVTARVRRDGRVRLVDAEDLVPGDVVVFDGGDVVTADVRLVAASRLQADESALTGESVPVDKQVEPVDADVPLAERATMLYKGTAVTRGTAEGVVVATGMNTELGAISTLVEEAESEATPLEQRLAALGRTLIGITAVVIVAVTASGVMAGRDLVLMVETGIALAVAAIPEGLPIVATIALARGMRRMARRNALVRRLASVETLGATRVICTDKTGTLTENQMTVTRLQLADAVVTVDDDALHRDDASVVVESGDANTSGATDGVRRALEVAVLCTDASYDVETGDATGDPLEVALLRAGNVAGLTRDALEATQPRLREEAFDAVRKMMATVHAVEADPADPADPAVRVAVKGAPEAVLDAATHEWTADGRTRMDADARARWVDRNEAMATSGLRVLAVAEKTASQSDVDPYAELTMLALVGLVDPPRDDVRGAIERCKAAGIDVVMVTGDQPHTARGIGQAVGLVDGSDESVPVVHGSDLPAFNATGDAASAFTDDQRQWLDTRLFARVTPAQKLDLIAMHQSAGRVVAMTGDGVNDAPALKKADIGIAMGQRGTQVAQEAADVVLTDDAFATIVAAVEQGRVIFRNIQRFVYYLMSCNVGEVLVVGLATLLGTTLPILPLQILFLNLVTDVFPALALGVGEGDDATMRRPPRPKGSPIVGIRRWLEIGAFGIVFAVAVLGALVWALQGLGMPPGDAVTVSFLTLALGQLWHVFNMRSPAAGFVDNDIVRNRYVWGALVLCVGLIVGAVYVPIASDVLSLTPPGPDGWIVAVTMSLIPLIVGQVVLVLRGSGRSSRGNGF